MVTLSPSGGFESAVVARIEPGFVLASLYDRIGGRLRFVGRGAALGVAAEHDHADALVQALAALEQMTGRRLVRNSTPVMPQTQDRRGVDTLLAVIRRAGRALRWSLVSTGQRPAAAQLTPLAAAVGSAPNAVIGLTSDDLRRPVTAAQRVAELFDQPIDALLVIHDPGARFDEPQQQALRMIGASMSVLPSAVPGAEPYCLLAADPAVAARWRPLLGERLRYLEIGPVLERDGSYALSRLGDAAAPMLAESVPAELGGIERLKSWLEVPPLHVREVNLRSVLAALPTTSGASVRLLDVAQPPDLVEVSGRQVRGLTGRLDAPLMPAGDEPPELLMSGLRAAASPWTLPATPTEVWSEAARCWKALGEVPAPAAPLDALVITGCPVLGERSGAWAALVGLTASPAPGVYALWNDGAGLLAEASALASLSPSSADEVLAGALTRLGTAVVAAAGGGGALRVDVQHGDGFRVSLEVADGDLDVLPVEPHQSARVQVRPSGRQDVGAGPGRPVDVTVRGGDIGLIVDNRAGAANLPVGPEAPTRWLEMLRGLAPRFGRPAAVARA